MDIRFHEQNGRIHFYYSEQVYDTMGRYAGRAYRSYVVQGLVPERVVAQGKQVVQDWATNHVQRIMAQRKQRDRQSDETYQATNIPIEVTYDGRLLKGKVIHKDGDLIILMESPVTGALPFTYGEGYAAAMSGRKVWQQFGVSFTPEALEYAREELVQIFQNHLNASVRNLVDRLNERGRS